MNYRWTTGPVVAGVLLSSLFVACGAQPGDATLGEAAPAVDRADATSPVVLLTTPAATPHKRPLRADGMPAGVKPFRPRLAPPVALDDQAAATDDAGPRFHDQVTPTCSNPKLTYFDGPLLQSPKVVTVFWSSYVNAALTAPTTGLAQFFTDVLASTSYLGWLQEYDSVGLTGGSEQAILGGTMTATVTLTPSRCASTTKCTVTDAEVQSELNAQITAGALPAPTVDCTGNTNTLYMVSFPPNVTITGPDGSGTSCANGGFCAYHNTGTYTATGNPLVYGILPDEFTSECDTGCGNGTAMENTTSTASHELIESITDPDIGLDTQNNYAKPAGWGDNNNDCGEIADICDTGAADTITVSGRTWSVQEVWSNAQGKCTSTGPDLAVCSGTTLTGCRKCSCGDTGNACTGATGVCETGTTNVLFGGCEQCTGANDTACGAAVTCTQSATAADDDVCAACVPTTSCPAGDNCGTVSNGCGGTLSCGTCAAPQTCGGGGNANQCGCTPATACPAGDDCGTVSNGCGGTLNCGTCAAPQTCGGTGTPNVCGTACVPATTCPAGQNCGTASNGCGGTLSCGACIAPQTCGGAGVANQCGTACVPLTVCPGGQNCGTASNGCGGTLSCGACIAPQTCGGAGVANQCGVACVPFTMCQGGQNCGIGSDGCGGTLNCGTCAAPQTCGGGGSANQCGCTPVTTCPAGQTCGSAPDGCGGTVACGTCSATETCNASNQCVAVAIDAGHDSGATTSDAGQTLDAGGTDAVVDSMASTDANAGSDAKTANDASTLVDSGNDDAHHANDSGSVTHDSGAREDAMASAGDATPANDATADGGAESGATGGCGCRTTRTTEVPAQSGLLLLIPLALIGRRRQRRAEQAG